MATAEDRVEALGEGKATFSIRPAEVGDVEAVAAIEAEAFSNPWHPHTFRSLIQQGRAHILIAEGDGGAAIGYAVVWWVHEQGELANLAVTRDHRGKGIGSALLDRVLAKLAEEEVESLFLEVRISNRQAFDLYLSRGFKEVARRKNYYRNPREDARILLKQLSPPDRPGEGGAQESLPSHPR